MDVSTAPEIRLEREGSIAWLILNRPEMRNPLGLNFSSQILGHLDELEADPECRVIILTGDGKGFCSGADLNCVVGENAPDAPGQFALLRGFNRITKRMQELELPIIAAINGGAVGGGAALAIAADLAIAAESAYLFFAFGRIGGTSADLGCTWLLPRLVGLMRARQLLLTGAKIDANECRELGLVIDVVADGDIRSAARALAHTIQEASPRLATAATKMAMFRGQSSDLGSALDYEAYMQTVMFHTPEHHQRLAKLQGKAD